MKLESKADTIIKLKHFDLNFLIPKVYIFKTHDWKFSRNKIIKTIQKNFKSKIVIRSSSFDEDLKNQSQAGKYLSVLGVSPKNKRKLETSIDKVIKSYKKKKYK